MNALWKAELKAAWQTWAAVFVTFVAVTFSLVLALLVLSAGLEVVDTGIIPEGDSAAVTALPSFNLMMGAIAALMVIGAATKLVVEARRAAIARLALAGATPKQVVNTIGAQLAVVTLAAAVIGDLLAVICLQPAFTMLLEDRKATGIPTAGIDPSMIITGDLLAVGLALLGGRARAREASRVAPVEALRQVVTPPAKKRVLSWIGAVVLMVITLVLVIGVPQVAAEFGKEGASVVMQAAIVALLLSAWALSLAAPVTVLALTRAWTALIPSRSAVWVIARSGTLARRERLANSVVPVSLAIGLILGMLLVASSVDSAIRASGHPGLDNAGVSSVLLLVGLPLVISIAGGLGSVIMMGRQRTGELALAGVAGATDRQRVAIPILEALIITVTATLLGLVMAALASITTLTGLKAVGYPAPFQPPWLTLATIVVISFVVTAAATTLPTLSALRRPAPRVVAQLIAD